MGSMSRSASHRINRPNFFNQHENQPRITTHHHGKGSIQTRQTAC
jgi:hypothetical protein